MWCLVFFFASAGASAAYLTVSEIFPMETRAMAIAFFYAVGTGLGGIVGPILFGKFIEQGKDKVVFGYYIGAGLMIAGRAGRASSSAVNAEQQVAGGHRRAAHRAGRRAGRREARGRRPADRPARAATGTAPTRSTPDRHPWAARLRRYH